MVSSNPPVFSTLIHIGAGKANELDSWLESGVESVVLVEPHPKLAEQLRQRTDTMRQVTVLEMALTTDPAVNQLHEFNLPDLDSLRLPTGLKQIFPGLNVVKSYPVTTGSLTQFLEKYLPQQDENVHLIIEAAGEETALIEEIIASDYLGRITSISLVAGVDSLYEGTKPAAELVEQLKAKGYDLQSEKVVNPEFGRWELRRNPLVDEVTQLKKQLEQTKAALEKEKELFQQTVEKQNTEVQQLNSLLEKQKQEFLLSIESKDSELAKQKSEQQEALKTHAFELEQVHKALIKEKELSQLVVEKQKSEVQQLNSLLEKQKQEFLLSIESKDSELAKQKSEQQEALKTHAFELEQVHKALIKEKELSQLVVEKLKVEVQQLTSLLEKQEQEFLLDMESKDSELSVQQVAFKTNLAELEQLKTVLHKEKEVSQNSIEKLNAELKQLTSSFDKQAEEFKLVQESTAKTHATELEAIKEDFSKHKGWLEHRKKQVADLELTLEKEKEKAQRLIQENELLKKSQETSNAGFQLLNERLEKLFSEQNAQIQQSTNALSKHVTQSFVDQRQHYQSVLGLQQYLESGEEHLEFGGWAIGPDVASHLIRALGQNSYDLIIEFGSGTSTVLMAKVIAKQLANSTEYTEYASLAYESPAPAGTQSQSQSSQVVNKAKGLERLEVQRRILSFEQDKKYHTETKQALLNQGLDGLVELVLAPLVPTAYSEQAHTSLFYDCDKQLARVSQLYGNRTARILVLVDGPFSPKADPLVREPALAHLLQHLSAHHLDIVLDDSKQQGEQQVVQQWRELCEERGLSYQEQTLEAEKGALWITVTP